ncbi:hypothetical protein LINPERPRIM_LOCUS22180 [Linum perenne]
MHYEGNLTYLINGELHYLGGEVRFWDWVDPDFISLFDIDSFLVDVGFTKQHRIASMEEHRTTTSLAYYWHNEKASLKDGLVEMKSDLDVYNLAADVVKGIKYVKLYLLHFEDVNVAMTQPQQPPILDSSSNANDIAEEYNSDCGDSDELESVYSSDEDGEVERRRYPQFHADTEMDNPSFCVEQIFSDFTTLKNAIKNYSLNNHRPLRFKHSDPKRLEVVCQTGCPWRIWASKRQDGRVQIKKATLDHSGCVLKFKNRFGDYKYIANKYVQRFQVDPLWSTRSVVQTVSEDLHMNISDSKAWRIRRTANKMVRGKEMEQYARLHDYCAEVRKSNVGSTIFVETNADSFFNRMYCCLDACRKGFLAGCRKVICVDGCFLKTEYGGQLLSAVGIDANNGIFPIAYAVVRIKNEDNWTWFLKTLKPT